MNEETRRELTKALSELFSNRDLDMMWRAVETIEDHWDDSIYEDYWKAVVSLSDDLLQARSLEVLMKHRGVRSLARVIRFIESEKILETGVKRAATYLSDHIYQLLADSSEAPDDTLFVLTVLRKSLAREGVKITPFLSTLLKELAGIIDPDDEQESSEHSLVWFLEHLFNAPMHKDILLEVVSLILNSRFRDIVLDRVSLTPELHATMLLYRRKRFVNAYLKDHDISGGLLDSPLLRFALRSLLSSHDVVRYNAAVVIREAVPQLDVPSLSTALRMWDGQPWEYSPDEGTRVRALSSRVEMRRALKVVLSHLVEEQLLFPLAVELTETGYTWHRPHKKPVSEVIDRLRNLQFRRKIPRSVKKLDLEKNRDEIEELLPVSLNEHELLFVKTVQEHSIGTKLHELYPEENRGDSTVQEIMDKLLPELWPDSSELENLLADAEEEIENLVRILLLMDQKAVRVLSETGYLLPLLQSGELDYHAMIDNYQPGNDVLDILSQLVEDREMRQALFLLTLYAFHIKAIRQETNKQVLEVVTRNTLVDPFWVRLPIELLPGLMLALIDAMANPEFAGLEGRLLRFLFRMMDRVPEEARNRELFAKVTNYLDAVEQRPIVGALKICIADLLEITPPDYQGPITFKEKVLRKRVAESMLRLIALGHQRMQQPLIQIFQKNEGLVEEVFETIKENAKSISDPLRSFLSEYGLSSVKLLFRL